MVVHQIKSEHDPFKDNVKIKRKFTLLTEGISGQLSSEMTVQQVQYHKKLDCTSQNSYKGCNGRLVRNSFQPKKLYTGKQKSTPSTLQ
jgi:hypothetical protein